MTGKPHVDPIRLEVIRHILAEVPEEMGSALRRSAYSTNIKDRQDFSCALFDERLRAVAQAFTNPGHLGAMVETVPQAVAEYGAQNLGAGDAILVNDPYRGGTHLNDLVLITPVHDGDEVFGYVATLAHHVDVGGGAPASLGAFREIYQEGIVIPPVKLVAEGEIVRDVLRLIQAQVRSKRETMGDLRAQIGANRTGVARLQRILHELGPETIRFYIEALFQYTERRTRAEMRKLPYGVFVGEGVVDDDGFTDEPVRLRVEVTVDETGILFDLTGCDLQREAPVNSTLSQTFAACAYVLKCLTDPDLPPNDGFYRLVRMNAPAGTVVNCLHPAPVVGGWGTQLRLTDVILKALAEAVPDEVPAGTKGMTATVGFGGLDPTTGEYYAFHETVAGGYGGRATSDGPDAVQAHAQNPENAPVEEIERNYAVRIVRYELVNDSEGAGRHRGGLGVRRDYEFVGHGASFTFLADRSRWGPWGLFGGFPGAKARYIWDTKEGTVELPSKGTFQVQPGDLVSCITCGGGGYGHPFEREPSLVLRDVRDGKVSADRARGVYGVAIDTESWTVVEQETLRLRAPRGLGD